MAIILSGDTGLNGPLNGTVGATTPSTVAATTVSASSLIATGSTSGSVTLSAPAVAGSTTQTLVNVTGTLAPLVSGTLQATTSGTAIDFTGIPSWVKRITVMLNGVSTNATNSRRYLIQLGSGGVPRESSYISQASQIGSVANTTNSISLVSTGFVLQGYVPTASDAYIGNVQITNITGNTWISSGVIATDTGSSNVAMSAGRVSLFGTLDMVRITTVSTPDTFDGGSVNIMYE
jgi:hypothetical protein